MKKLKEINVNSSNEEIIEFCQEASDSSDLSSERQSTYLQYGMGILAQKEQERILHEQNKFNKDLTDHNQKILDDQIKTNDATIQGNKDILAANIKLVSWTKWLAIITGAAVFVALIAAAVNSFYSEQQLSFLAVENRPFIHTNIDVAFAPNYKLLDVVNSGPVPGVELYQNVSLQVYNASDRSLELTQNYPQGSTSSVSIYSNEEIPTYILNDPLPAATISDFKKGKNYFEFSVCTVYRPLAEDDNRQWETDEIWQDNNSNFTLISSGEKVTTNTSCDAAALLPN